LTEKLIQFTSSVGTYISDKQNESSKDLKRLITLDELSEDFWNVSNLTHFAALCQPLKYLKRF
jgi:hypothetical protein